jgi:hypothetical protein
MSDKFIPSSSEDKNLQACLIYYTYYIPKVFQAGDSQIFQKPES